MQRVAVIDVVGLDLEILRFMPRTKEWTTRQPGGAMREGPFPGLTTTGQAAYFTGNGPERTGIVGNGWYDRDLAEVLMWKQPEHLVKDGDRMPGSAEEPGGATRRPAFKLWDVLKERCGEEFTCAKVFWWYNMCSSADWTVTPRPLYPADGRKVFDIHTFPMEMREDLKRDLGKFPFQNFWGPMSGIASSKWIARSARWIERRHEPTLSLVYLPHLDYELQRSGPGSEASRKEAAKLDGVLMELVEFYERREIRVVMLSEYGIEEVNRPVYLNRELRRQGWIEVKDELGRETLYCDGSGAFAVCDHQVAHVYVKRELGEEHKAAVAEFLGGLEGVARVIDPAREWPEGPGRDRAGDLVVEAEAGAWFCYYFWEDDRKAPDFAACIDIFRKTGYDPCELFFRYPNPLRSLHLAGKLAKIKLGMRTLMDVIPLQPEMVRGSHGRAGMPLQNQPVCFGLEGISSWRDVYFGLIQAVAKEGGN